jgi:hypothetical protein
MRHRCMISYESKQTTSMRPSASLPRSRRDRLGASRLVRSMNSNHALTKPHFTTNGIHQLAARTLGTAPTTNSQTVPKPSAPPSSAVP